MEWVEGVRCTEPGAFASPEARRRFIRLGIESGLRQLLDFGLFHGDPHPGNVLAQPDGKIAYAPGVPSHSQLTYIREFEYSKY